MEEETVTIKKSEYERMLKSIDWLECLNAAGVDSWSGIDYAVEILEEDTEAWKNT